MMIALCVVYRETIFSVCTLIRFRYLLHLIYFLPWSCVCSQCLYNVSRIVCLPLVFVHPSDITTLHLVYIRSFINLCLLSMFVQCVSHRISSIILSFFHCTYVYCQCLYGVSYVALWIQTFRFVRWGEGGGGMIISLVPLIASFVSLKKGTLAENDSIQPKNKSQFRV